MIPRELLDELKRLRDWCRVMAREAPMSMYEAGFKAAFAEFAVALDGRMRDLATAERNGDTVQ